MNNKNPLIVLLLAVFFTAGGGITLYYYQSSHTQAEEGTPPDPTYYPPKNDEVKQAEAEADKIMQEESAHGCLENLHGHQVFCGESKKRVDAANEKAVQAMIKSQTPSQEILEQRFEAMRVLKDNPQLTFTFEGTSGNPYLNGNTRRMESYRDKQDTVYWIDAQTGSVIQYGPSGEKADWYKFTPMLTKTQLKEKALAYLSAHIKNFDQVQKEFTYEEYSKGTEGPDIRPTYAFRWEGRRTPGEDMPPFVQVVLTAAGDIPTFNDTRALYTSLNQ